MHVEEQRLRLTKEGWAEAEAGRGSTYNHCVGLEETREGEPCITDTPLSHHPEDL